MKEKNSYIGGLHTRRHFSADRYENNHDPYSADEKTTEQYPENRSRLKLSDRFRGTLTMPHNDKNEHRCELAVCARWLVPTTLSR